MIYDKTEPWMKNSKKAERKQEEAKEKKKDYSFPAQAEIVISTLSDITERGYALYGHLRM